MLQGFIQNKFSSPAQKKAKGVLASPTKPPPGGDLYAYMKRESPLRQSAKLAAA